MAKTYVPFRAFAAGIFACILLSACTTTSDAERRLATAWPGKPVDAFFAAYGPPASSYKLSDGGVIYTWRGGRIDKHIPADYRLIRRDPFYDPFMDGRPYGPRFGPWFDDPEMVMVSPARDMTLRCEAQITTDRAKKIVSIRISGDTEGDGFSQSRCADIFGTGKAR